MALNKATSTGVSSFAALGNAFFKATLKSLCVSGLSLLQGHILQRPEKTLSAPKKERKGSLDKKLHMCSFGCSPTASKKTLRKKFDIMRRITALFVVRKMRTFRNG